MTPLSLTQATAISRKFAIERERLSQEKADVERQLRSLEHGPKEGPKVLPPKLSLPHLPPLPKFNNVPRDTPKSEEEATTTDEPKAARRIQSKSTYVLKEIATLRMEYLKNGGVNPLILEQINQLEARAMTGTIRVKEGQTNNNNTDPTFQAGNHSIDNSNMTAATAAERENLKGITFEEIDMISIPPYDEYRGLSLFLDLVTGVPYFGGGSTAKLDLFYTVFNGATASCPVDTITTTCHRQPVSYVGKAIISEVQRFYDIPSTSKHRLLFQFSTSDSSDSHTDAEIRPIAWTSFDLFNDNGSLNQGRWRLSLFHPPVDFRATTYHLYSNLAIIPNMFLYIRVVHPMLQAHHKRINVSAIDVRNTAAGSEYRIFKPSYNNFEFYDAVQISHLSEKRSMSTILDIPPEISASGNLRGSRVLGSTNTLNMNQVLHCSVGFRVDQLKNLDISSDTNVRVKIMIGNQKNPWVSGFAEMGFTKNTYGWPDDVAEVVCNDLPIIAGTTATVTLLACVGDEDERVISLEPIVLELFLELEDSIVVNEGVFNPIARIINTQTPCELTIRIYSDARIPAPFNFDSKRLDKPMPQGAWLNVSRDSTDQCVKISGNGGLESFRISIDGVRFLPENSTICRIQCQFVDRDENVVEGTPQLDLLPDNDSSAYFPQYMNSTQIDLPPIIDGTMMAYIKIFTIDRHTRQLVTVGFAVFNIFITEMNEDRDGGIQPCTADERPICLNDGYHQIPVYNWTSKTTFKDSGGLQVSGIRNQRVPCCSLLLRISAGQDLPIKQYKERVYISTLCTPLPYESGIFYFLVRERPLNATIRAALQQLKQDVQAANDEALVIWMARRIAKEKGVIPPMDLSCILKFHEGWGFKISIDMAENLKNKAFSIATLCLSPPAILYASKRKSIMNATMEDVMYNQKLNFSTTVRSPEWKDGFLWYRKYPFNSRLLAVVDIRCLGYSEQDKQYRLQSQGWTLLPVFHDSGFVKYGTYQLPLFDGLPTPDLLDQFSKSEIDTDELIAQNIKSKVIRYAKRHGTVFVRICDGRRERELPFVKDDAVPKNVMIRTQGLFEFDDSLPFTKLLPKGVSEDEYERRCLGTLVDLTGLPRPMKPRE